MSGLIGGKNSKSGIVGETPFRAPRGHFVTMAVGGTGGWNSYGNNDKITMFNTLPNSYLTARGPAGITGGNNIDGAYDTSTNRYTAKWAGSYFFWAKIYTFQSDTHNIMNIWINGNRPGDNHGTGNTHLGAQGDGFGTFYSNNTQDDVREPHQCVFLNVGDYLELYAGTASVFHGGNSVFGGYMIGES